MLACFFFKKMAKSCLLAPVFLRLIFHLPKVAEGALEENRTKTKRSPFQPPALERVQDASSTQGHFLRGEYGAWPARLQQETGSSQAPPGILVPVAQPSVWRVPLQEEKGIQLLCRVSAGTVTAIEWRKDGKVVARARGHPPAANLSLPGAEPSTCGSYSCNASNAIGWKESALLRLTLADMPMVLAVSFQTSAAVLVLAAFSGCGVLMPLCHPQKLQIRGKAWKCLSIYANGLACLASILALAALILWSCNQGFSASLIPPLVLLLHVIAVTVLVVATVAFKLDVLQEIREKAGTCCLAGRASRVGGLLPCRDICSDGGQLRLCLPASRHGCFALPDSQPAQRMLDFTTPGGVILDGVIAGLLMKHIHQLQEQNCAAASDPAAVVAVAAGTCLLPFMAIVAIHCMDMKRQTAEDRVSRRKN